MTDHAWLAVQVIACLVVVVAAAWALAKAASDLAFGDPEDE